MAKAGERQRFRVFLTDSYGDLVDGHWETEERLDGLPAAGVLLYVRSADRATRMRARVRQIDPGATPPIVATVEPLR